MSWLASALAACLAGAADDPLRFDELPLANDAFVAVEAAAEEQLARGDEALVEARAASEPAARIAALAACFEAWRDALLAAPAGGWVALAGAAPDESGAPRAFEGVEAAVHRRLAGLEPEERGAWRERFEPLAKERLESALSDLRGVDPRTLDECERGHPGTAAALRACLARFDLALARGEALAARTAWHRAGEHALLVDETALSQAIAQRAAALPDAAAPEPDTWSRAWSLRTVASVPLGLSSVADRARFSRALHLAPGLAVLDDGRVAVQGPRGVELFDADTLEPELSLRPAGALPDGISAPPQALPSGTAPAWRLAPATDGRDLLLVEGRSFASMRGSNVLLRLSPPARQATRDALAQAEDLPTCVWAWRGRRLVTADGELRDPLPELLRDLDPIEVQPAPLLLAERAVCAVRKSGGELEHHLVGFDWATGEPAWRRFLAKGSQRGARGARFADATGELSGTPLMHRSGHRILSTSALGTTHLVDALDGRAIWTLRTQRIDPDPADARFDGSAGAGGDGRPLVVAPPDSDFLYWLPDGPLAPTGDGALALPAPPLDGGEALALLASAPDRPLAYVAHRRGFRQALASFDAVTGARRDALELAPREALAAHAWISSDGARLIALSDRGAYLFDLEADLRLLDAAAWPSPDEAEPERHSSPWIVRRGARLFALSGDRLWSLGLDG